MSKDSAARRWFVSGRVQGVGFRDFTLREALSIGLAGWVRNLDDGRVEAYAVGTAEQLDGLAARLHRGPVFSEVRAVEQIEAELQRLTTFSIK